jgi:hypothetical protein
VATAAGWIKIWDLSRRYSKEKCWKRDKCISQSFDIFWCCIHSLGSYTIS